MLLYITLGTNDLAAAQKFYDATLLTLGIVRRATQDDEIGYGKAVPNSAGAPEADPNDIQLWITKPFDGRPATVSNGSMPAFVAPTRASVDAFYDTALLHNGTDEGAPGIRYRPNFYACYLRDPDGNKISAVCVSPED
jgi:catechol 2,3-dioxygenase-like lactoylglutathione lyase family enzyme